MIATSRYRQIRYRAQEELSKQSCEHVHQRDNFLSRYAPLNFIKKRRADETLCFRVRRSIPASSTCLSPGWMCAQAINQLRQLLTTRQKEQYHRCEVWVFLRTGQQHCSEVVKNGIREVACA